MSEQYTASDGSLWHVCNCPPPVPTRALDWEWVSDDYGGPGDDSHGYAPTKEAAIAAVEEWVEENREVTP